MGSDPPPGPAAEIARDCVAGRVRLLNRVVTKLYDDALRPHGLRVSQLNILAAVAHAGPLRGVDVARHLRLDASTLSRDLERLIDRKWIAATAGVGRARRLEATAAGRAVLAAAAPAWRKAQAAVRALLSPAGTAGLVAAADALGPAAGRGDGE